MQPFLLSWVMEYDEILKHADMALEVFRPERLATLTYGNIISELGLQSKETERGYIMAGLKRLVEDKYLGSVGANNDYYNITGTTFAFKAKGGYKTLVEEEKRRLELKSAVDDLGFKSTQSVIDTNASIQNLNQSTSTFYKKQTSFNKWQKGLTIAIMLSTAAYTIISYFMLTNQNKQLEQEKTKSQTTIQEIKSQILQDSVFLKQLKDSLKK